MARFILKLILCLLVALAAGFGYLALRSGDALYSFYEWVSPARFQQYDKLILSVAAEHQLDPMLVKAVVWRESRFDRQKYGTAGERGLMQVSEKAANEWAREHKIDHFRSTNSSIQRQILRPVRGICGAPSTIGRTNPSPCPSRLPNTTPERAAFSAGLEPVESRPASLSATSISLVRANMFNRFSIATLFTKSAAECESAFA